MKKVLCYIAAVLFCLAAGSLSWLLGTPGGARWIMKTVSAQTGVKVFAQKMDGRLIGTLEITGLRLVWREGEIRSGILRLSFRPLSVLAGRIEMGTVELDDVSVQDDRPDRHEPVDLSWPKVTGLATHFDAAIDALKVDRFVYRRLQKPAVEIRSLKAAVRWHSGTLDATGFEVRSSSFRAQGDLALGLSSPLLSMTATTTLAKPAAGVEIFTVKGRVKSDPSMKNEAAGDITIAGRRGQTEVFSLKAGVGIGKTSVRATDVVLRMGGGKGSIEGSGEIDFRESEPRLRAAVSVEDLDLETEVGRPTRISGMLHIEGQTAKYRGDFSLANSEAAWQAVSIAGSFDGDFGSVTVRLEEGTWLNGQMEGTVTVGWSEGLSLAGSLRAQRLDPSVISPEWDGTVNFDMGLQIAKKDGRTSGSVKARLRESMLRGRPLTGRLDADLIDDNVILSVLSIEGKGFAVAAAGDLEKKISFSIKAEDLSGLVRGSRGRLLARGDVERRHGKWGGSITASGRSLSLHNMAVDSLGAEGSFGISAGSAVRLTASMKGISLKDTKIDALTVTANGTVSRHSVKVGVSGARAEVKAGFDGGYSEGVWTGRISTLSGHDKVGTFHMTKSAPLKASGKELSINGLSLEGEGGEALGISSEIFFGPQSGSVDAHWKDLRLRHAQIFLKDGEVSGSSSGMLSLKWNNGRLEDFAANGAVSGDLRYKGKTIRIEQGSIVGSGNVKGGSVSLHGAFKGGGQVEGRFRSTGPVGPSVPVAGDLEITWKGIDLSPYGTLLSPSLELQGRLSGSARGTWLPDKAFALTIESSVSGGRIQMTRGGKSMTADIRSAAVKADWRDKGLKGSLSLLLPDYGSVSSDFSVPLPARFPLAIDPKGPVRGSLKSNLSEKGLLTSLFPGLVQESSGKVTASLSLRGQWEAPSVTGSLTVEKAGAYFPAAGVHISNVSLTGRLDGDKMDITSFHAESGPGSLDGTAVIRFKGWNVLDYKGAIKGGRFQTFYLPEIRMLVNPDLTFEGAADKLTLRGEVTIPELLVSQPPKTTSVKASPDVVVVERREKEPEKTHLAFDMKVLVKLGDHVFVKAEGLDVQLKGSVELTAKDLSKVYGSGTIEVVKGNYKSYGVDLVIQRGKLFFTGGPADNPALDILAVRTVGEVKAGVTATGRVKTPLVTLYSEPAMTDTDTLAYIVLGHPMTGGKEQASLMALAAGQLLSAGQSAVLHDKIKQRLGLDTLDVETGGGAVARSMVTVGKFITPKLYISYGRSLFTNADLVKARYSLSKKWEVDVQSGEETGADLFFKIEFR